MQNQEAQSPIESELTLRDILNVLFRFKKRIILFFVVVTSLVVVVTLEMPKTYRSNAQIMIRLGRENTTLDPTVAMGTAMNVNESRENEINSEMEVIKCRELAERVIKTIGVNRIIDDHSGEPLDRAPTPRDSSQLFEQAVLLIANNLSTELVKKTNVINITFDHSDPKTAQTVIDNLIQFYNEKHMLLYRPAGALSFFKNQTDTLNVELTLREDSLRQLKNLAGISTIESQRELLTSRMNSLKFDYEQTTADLAASNAKINSMQQNLQNISKIIAGQNITGSSFSSSDALREKLNELKMRKDELLTKFNEGSRLVTDLQDQINQTAALLEKEDFDNNRSNATREMQMNLLSEQSNNAALSAKALSISRALTKSRAELVALNNNSVGISKLLREHEIVENTLKKYSENLEQSRFDSDLKAGKLSNIAIVQPATLPVKPIKPRKLYNLILGLFFGLFGGLCLAFVAEFLDHTIKNPEEIEKYLKLQTLATLPYIKAKDFERHESIYNKSQETFDALGGVLHRSPPTTKIPKVIGVTSCCEGEGVSTVTINLAKSLAARYSQAKVLLVDFNTGKSEFYSFLGVKQFVEEEESSPATFEPETTALQIFPPLAVNSTPRIHLLPVKNENDQVLKFSQIHSIVKIVWSIKNKYTHILFDIPPISRKPVASELASILDGLVLVIEAERVRREALIPVLTKLRKQKMVFLGAILNKRKLYVPQSIYKML